MKNRCVRPLADAFLILRFRFTFFIFSFSFSKSDAARDLVREEFRVLFFR